MAVKKTVLHRASKFGLIIPTSLMSYLRILHLRLSVRLFYSALAGCIIEIGTSRREGVSKEARLCQYMSTSVSGVGISGLSGPSPTSSHAAPNAVQCSGAFHRERPNQEGEGKS